MALPPYATGGAPNVGSASAPIPPNAPDEDDNLQSDVEDLEKRVSAIEAKLGISSPPDMQDADPLKAAIGATRGAFGS